MLFPLPQQVTARVSLPEASASPWKSRFIAPVLARPSRSAWELQTPPLRSASSGLVSERDFPFVSGTPQLGDPGQQPEIPAVSSLCSFTRKASSPAKVKARGSGLSPSHTRRGPASATLLARAPQQSQLPRHEDGGRTTSMDWAPGTAAPQRTHSAAVRRKPSNPRSTLLHVYDRGLRMGTRDRAIHQELGSGQNRPPESQGSGFELRPATDWL